eukprot:GEMP01018777.1.p1 GENE.GEMP01018777.1~~GEMP01018777.1.p1  ORF type:complete len:700 (+),score=252.38 GEMP01018777.1:184-2283(+)
MIMKSLFIVGVAAVGLGANPIRKVVNMLNMMSEKVEAEGERGEKLFDKYLCYCKTTDAKLSSSIETGNEKIPQLKAGIKEDASAKSQLESELKSHKSDRAEDQNSLKEAHALREKEAAQFSTDSGEAKTNSVALGKAIKAIESNIAGSAFLQTTEGAVLKNLLSTSSALSDDDRISVTSFLSGTASSTARNSGEIVGILKQMKEDMEKDLADMTKEEAAKVKAAVELTAGKTKEIAAVTSAIESKTERVGTLAVQVAEASDDLEDAEKSLASDTEFLGNLREGCEHQKKNFAAIQQSRSQELAAIAETIKILNDDDSLDLFKKALPSPEVALIQLHGTSKAKKLRALNVLQQLPASAPVSLIALSLKGKKVNFSKVVTMIDELVAVLHQEQEDAGNHKEYCEQEFDSSDDKKKATQREIAGSQSKSEEITGAISAITSEIAALKSGIVALDKAVVEATEQRKEEHSEFVSTSSDNQKALDLIAFAKNRLAKFYNPKLYKAPPAQELSEEDRIYSNFGGEVPTPAPPGGIAGTGIGALFLQTRQKLVAAPPPAPAYKKQGGASGGVTAMMDNLMNDLKKEMQEAEFEEKDAQQEYEKLMADSKKKRAADSESITNKDTAKAEADELLSITNDSLQESQAELLAVNQAIANLHSSCDFLLQNYDASKQARNEEVDALTKSKAVLAGADYSLTQRSTNGFLQ